MHSMNTRWMGGWRKFSVFDGINLQNIMFSGASRQNVRIEHNALFGHRLLRFV